MLPIMTPLPPAQPPGPPPLPDTASLAAALEADGIDPADVTIELIPKTSVGLGSDG